MTEKKVKIAPSILASDFARMGEEAGALAGAGADWIHFDVMDGHFVPNISFGAMVCKAVRPYTPLPLDVHLMVSEPSAWIDSFAEAGANGITLHPEAELHVQLQLQRIRDHGRTAGLALNPATPPDVVEYVLDYCDLVLVMSVNPGFGGQQFLPLALKKIEALRRMIDARGLKTEIEVDGGINPDTARQCIDAGATVLVAGSTVFHAPDKKAMIERLRG